MDVVGRRVQRIAIAGDEERVDVIRSKVGVYSFEQERCSFDGRDL